MNIPDLARRHGTPLYAYDLDAMVGRATTLRAAVPSAVDLAFAVKANPSLAVVRALAGAGMGADVASGGELALAIRAGVAPERIVVTGPGKRDAELRAATDAGVRAITVESLAELARLERIASELGRIQPVMLRLAITPPPAAGHGTIAIGGSRGLGAQFGMGLADLRSGFARAAASPHLEPLGVHAFGLSNVRDAAVIGGHVRRTVALARRVAAEVGVPLRLVDTGGGLGIPYADGEAPLDVAGLGRLIARILRDDARQHPGTPPIRIVLEPGRWLTGPAGIYVAAVLDVKAGRGETIAILDGGIHHFVRPALVGAAHRVEIVPGPNLATRPARRGRVTLAGPLCTGLDVIATLARVPMPMPGDLVVVRDAGAYGFTESMPFFLSHPTPIEVAVSGGRSRVARPPMHPDRWTRSER